MEQEINKYKVALKKAASKIQDLSDKIAQQNCVGDIAIIGYSCRFPGMASNPEKFWDVLANGIDTVTEINESRFDYHKYYSENADEAGKMCTKYGAFLSEPIDEFDNTHFGISAIEAGSIDPQHRLLLEVSWEAMENSALNIEKLKGSRTGVFVGINSFEYAKAELFSGDVCDITPYSTTGASLNSSSGRLSYFYDFKGPAITCDTACSSSLTALNAAMESLKNNQCDMAIVGGVNLLLSPESFIGLSKFNGLSKDGRCKAFDDSADGFGRGEGCGVVILKRLKDAKVDENNIVAIVKGVCIGQDGRSNGFTAPNGLSQQNVIGQALKHTNLSVDDLDYIETHGTGTPLGDFIEAQAISEVFKKKKTKMLIGSVKSNIGHLEAASGIASLIKVIMCIEKKKIPPSIHFKNPNHNVVWDKIKVIDKLIDWDKPSGIRRAGISSFGFSGTLAHAIIEEPPIEEVYNNVDILPYNVMTLSAKTEKSLKEYISIINEYLSQVDETIEDITYTTNVSKSFLKYKFAITGKSKDDFVKKLEHILSEIDKGSDASIESQNGNNEIAFLFTGQGSIYKDIAKNLYNTSKPFREALDLCNKKFKDILEISLLDAIYGENDKLIDNQVYSQPIIFSIEYALTKVWDALGIKPKVVIGHSIGEYVAACYAGLISLNDAVVMIAQRGKLMQSVKIDGKMVGVLTNVESVEAAIEEGGYKNVSIAAINAPNNVTISGLRSEVDAVVSNLQSKKKIFINKLNISHPYHSCMMESYVRDYDKDIGDIKFSKLQVNMISGISGDLENEDVLGKKKYWTEHLSNTVRYESAIETAKRLGINIFIEIGGDATLSGLASQCIEDKNIKFLPSLRKGVENYVQLLESVSSLFLSGVEINWKLFHKTYKKNRVKLPNYQFQRKRFWKGMENKDGIVKNNEENLVIATKVEVSSTGDTSRVLTNSREKIELELKEMIHSVTWLEIDEIEADMNLFSLGLDSLVLVTFNKKISGKYNLNISLNEFFTNLDTIERIAEYINQYADYSILECETNENSKKSSFREELNISTDATNSQALIVDNEASSSFSDVNKIQQIFESQMRVMTGQIEVLNKFIGTSSKEAVIRSRNLTSVKNTESIRVDIKENKINEKNRNYYVPYKKLNLTEKEKLDDLKLKYIKNIENKYTSYTKKSKENTQKYRKVYANNRNVAGFRPLLKEMIYQIVAQKGKGSKLYDIDGNELIDLTMGFGVNLFGHNPSFVEAALKEEISNGMPLGPMGRLAGQVAEQINELTGAERVAFYNSGTEANMVAVRLARAITGRKKIVTFAGSYHGTFDGLLGLAYSKDGVNTSIPLAPGVVDSMIEDLIILNYDSEESLEFIKNNSSDIAGVLVEAVQSRRPDVQPKEFLYKLRKITEEKDIALIFDEIITGFRIAPGGVQEYFGIKADMATYGKVAGGGMPIGIVSGKSKYLDSIDGGMWSYGDDSIPPCDQKRTFVAGTFSHHPMAMAAADATLKYIKENKDNIYKSLNEKTSNFVNRMNLYFQEINVPISLVSFGSLFRFVLNGDFEILFYGLLEKGIYIWEGRNCFFSTEHSDEDIEKLILAIKLTIEEMSNAGYFGKDAIDSTTKKKKLIDKKTKQLTTSMSLIQQRLYTQSMISDQDPYNITSVLNIKGKLDFDKLESVINEITRRHESLRTRLYVEEGQLKQEVLAKVNFKVTKIKKANDEDLEDLIKKSITKFNLEEAPLFKITLIYTEGNEETLIFNFHHTIADGISMNIFVQEFIKLYSNEMLAPLNKQYRDFIDWEKNYIDSDTFKVSEKYWLNKLSGNIDALKLPLDYPVQSKESFAGNTVKTIVSRAMVSELKTMARSNQCSLYMVLVTALNVLLKKLSRSNDILIGTPVTNRGDGLFDESIGMYTNTIVLRNNPSDDKQFGDFLKEVKQNCLEAYSHMYYPFNFLIDNINKGKHNDQPLINVMFIYENTDQRVLSIDGLEISPYDYNANVSEFDFVIEALEENGILNINLTYKTSLFKEETIMRWGKYYKNILDFVLREGNKDSKIEDIDIIGDDEKYKLLVEFNDTKVEYPKNITIYELFQEQVEKTPNNIAVVYEDAKLTYMELNEKANQLARVLLEKGVKPDSIVGIMVERSLDLMIGIIGILKAGGAYLPIDPEYPEDRIDYVLKDSCTKILVTQGHLMNKVNFMGILVDLNDNQIYTGEKSNLEKTSNSNNLSYVIYTSGSTGNPKGVMIEHRNAINFITGISSEIKIEEKETILALTTISFDIFFLETLYSLTQGLKIIIASSKIQNDANYLNRFISENNISIIQTTPSRIQLLANSDKGLSSLSNVEKLLIGGEALIPSLFEELKNIGVPKLYNMYGPTETTVWSAIKELTNSKEVNIGKPISNTRIYIMGENNRIQPIGVAGELCIAGDGVARGYLNKPELTKEKFLANPYEQGELMYKTGDLARWLPNGEIECIGRTDYQVKIRGFRIELGEIESQLLKNKEIKEAVVVGLKDKYENAYLCAYLVSEKKITIAELRRNLSKKLPDYMIPSYFIQIENMPLTPNGKIDRKALPEPDGEVNTGVQYVAPRNKLEEKMVNTWSEVLEVDRVGIDDDFFTLGGHSLNATLLLGRMHKELNVEIPLKVLFMYRKIRDLSEYILTTNKKEYEEIKRVEEKEAYEASSAQKRMYMLKQIDKDSVSYNMPAVIEITGELEVEKMNKAFLSLINRHETLRTSFYAKEDMIMQKIHNINEIQFKVEIIQANCEDEVEEKFHDFITSFNLEKAPLLRVAVISLEKERHFMFFDMHHIISDGMSLAILTKEFGELYVGKKLEDLNIQYKDYSAWQLKKNKSNELKKQEEYWLNEFSEELPILNLPTDYERTKVKDFNGDTISFSMNMETTEKLRKISKETGSTMYMLLLANINILFSKYSGEQDIVIGTAIAGRNHKDLESIIGMFVNTLAIRSIVNGELSFSEYLKSIKEKVLGAFENQDYQFDELVDLVYEDRDLSRNPIFDIMFVLENMNEAAVEVENLIFKPDYSYNTIEKFDITISAVERNNEIKFDFSYATSLYKKETIERMVTHFLNIVKVVVENMEISIKDIEMISDDERNKLLYEFNDTESDYPKNKTLAELFEEQVEETPNNIAVVYEDKRLTYRELNEKSNALAKTLQKKGVKKDVIVGLMVNRSIEMIVGAIAILKAGGAYLPLDSEYPEDRIKYIIKDSGAHLILIDMEKQNILLEDMEVLNIKDSNSYSEDCKNLKKSATSESLAYVIYTSGTTGTPKGVEVIQKSVIRLTKNTNYIEIKKDEKLLQTGSIAFDASTFEFWGILLNGASLYMADKNIILDPKLLENYLIENNITILWLTSALFNNICEENANAFTGLKLLLIGGDIVSHRYINLALKNAPDVTILNMYGPTENTTFSTFYLIKEPVDETKSIPIGIPVSNTTAYILDNNSHMAPIGVVGELYLSGEGLARGYINNDKLTKEKFIDNPYELGRKMYRTGDLVRWLPDGNIEFLGRIDNQVKIRGFRIELGEIENNLLKIDGIKQALVIAREKDENKYLDAYYTSEKEYSVAEIRNHLKKHIPAYMVPSHFIQLDEMPITQNGKVDRKKLPIDNGEIYTGVEYEEARNKKESDIASIWATLLNVKKVGINDNFFVLGGDSIKAIQVIAKMNSNGYYFELKDLFAKPTIKELVEYEKETSLIIDQSEVKGEIELTPIQKWFLEETKLLKNHFNQDLMLFSEKGFEKNLVEDTFNIIIKHHDVLRAVYVNGKFINKEISDKLYDINIYDLRGSHTENEHITNLCTSIQASMNLQEGPLVKLGIFKTDEGDHLLIAIHHMIVDGVSWRIIIEDFNNIYNGLSNGNNIELPLKTTSFKEWSAKQKEYSCSYKLKNEISYWNKLSNMQVKKLFKDYEPKNLSLNMARSKTITINSDDTKKLLTKVNLAYSTEINDILLSALTLTIGKFNSTDKILINLESHGREEIIENVDITRTVGWFTSQYPIILENKDSITKLLKSTKDKLRRVPYNGIGYGILKYLSDYEMSDTVQPEISFNYLGQFDDSVLGRNFRLSNVLTGESISKDSERCYPLDIVGIIAGKELQVTVNYNSEEYRDETMENLLQNYKENVIMIIEHCISKENVEVTASDITREDISLEELEAYSFELEDIKSIYSLTPMQEGLLYHSVIESGEAYHVNMEIKINGELNVDALNESFNKLVSKYDILRTTFDNTSFKENMQVVYKTRKADLEFRDIRDIDSDKEEYIINLIMEDRKIGFDLSKDFLIRLFVVRIDENEYSLILCYHHIILDGWSFGIISSELFNMYNSIIVGNKEEIKKQVPYEEYIDWLKLKDKEKALSYWKQYLAGYSNNINVPFKKKKTESGKPQEVLLTINRDRTKLIETLAKDNAVTVNTVLQAIWAIQLQRYNNVEDVVFGYIVSGRATEIKNIDEIVGLFINTIPLRVNTEDNKCFTQIIKKIQSDFTENEQYNYLSIAQMQNLTEVKDGLINTLMVFENYPIDKNLGEQADIKIGDVKCYEETNYSFNLKVIPGEEMTIIFDYNDGVYSEESVNRIKCHFDNILNQVEENSNILINEIEIVDEIEKDKVLIEFNDTNMDIKKDTTIQELFEYQVYNNSEKAAILYEGKTMNYSELNMKANSLAKVLRDRGIGANSIVAIMVERSFEMCIGILAILKAGAAYLPIDLDYPDKRIDYIINDSSAEILLTTSQIAREKSLQIKKVIEIENEELYTKKIKKLKNINNSNDLAYVIYTSGTTGKPKGTMVEHNGVVNLKNWFEKELEIGGNEKILQFASVAFDAFSWELFMSLLLGNTFCIPHKNIIMDPDLLNEYIRDNNITIVTLPPFVASNLEADNGLRRVITAGSEVKMEQISHLLDTMEVINAYGPTEDTVCTTYYKVKNCNIDRIPIGKPIKNHRILILDKNNKLVPIGVEGQLCIAGEGLARGYLNNEKLTKEKFIENPYIKGDKLYMTGDVGRWLPNGDIEYLGRVDYQIKIRGFRIEIGEIEENILKIPEVSDVAVIDREKDGLKYICAYYVSKGETEVDILRKTLMRSLPKYMIPSYFVELDKLPFNTNGKVDRSLLPEPELKISINRHGEETKNEIENRIIDACKKVLGLEQLYVTDNLFEVGADSIRIAKICKELKKEGINISIRDIFYYENIRDIYMNCIYEGQSSEQCLDYDEFASLGINEIKQNLKTQIDEFSKTIMEQKIVKKYSTSGIQNISREANLTYSGAIMNFDYKVNVELLKKSIVSVINTQSLLRSILIKSDTSMEIQEYDILKNINIPYLNLEKTSDDEKEHITRYIINDIYSENLENKQEVFNKILYKIIIIKLSDVKYKIYMPFNHLIFDGMSMEIIKANISKAYSNNGVLKEDNLLEYSDYVNQLSKGPQEITEEEILDKFNLHDFNLSFRKYFKKFKDSNLVNTTISIKLTKDIEEAIRECHWEASLKIFSEILKLNFGIDSIPFSIMYHGRGYQGKKYYNTIGEFIDILPLKLERNQYFDLDYVKNLISLTYKKNINFSTLMCNKDLSNKYKNIVREFKNICTEKINIPIFNYSDLYDSNVEMNELIKGNSSYQLKEISTEINIVLENSQLSIRLFCDEHRIAEITKELESYIYKLY